MKTTTSSSRREEAHTSLNSQPSTLNFEDQSLVTSAATRPDFRKRTKVRAPVVAMALLCLISTLTLPAQTVTQSFDLRAGWNAIYLEVTPVDSNPAAVFTNLPVASVWTRIEPVSTAQFIQNASEESFNDAQWLRWLPGKEPFLSSLKAVLGRRTYLLKLTNGPVSWQVTGRPDRASLKWNPNAWNLRAFPDDPVSPPTFKEFFQYSPAHYDAIRRTMIRPVYRLSAESNAWIVADMNTAMRAGEAYWVYCEGASDYAGPIKLGLDTGEALEFGQGLERATLTFDNLATQPRTVTLRQLGTNVPGVLAYQRFNATNAFEWAELPDPFVFEVLTNSPRTLNLAVRRSRMTNTLYTSILEISDGQGTRYRVPVTAEKIAAAMQYAGLWVGSVAVNAVSEPHFGTLVTNRFVMDGTNILALTNSALVITTNWIVRTNADWSVVTNELLVVKTASSQELPVYEKIERNVGVQTPTPTKSEFTMRLLLHVDTNGISRLLKEVTQMWRDGTYTNDYLGYRRVHQPGTDVLVTIDDLLSQFKGATLRNGVSVGRRLSAIGFDFDGRGTNHMNLAGTFGTNLTGTITLAATNALNPFRHKYHPDHDNLDNTDENFKRFKAEAYAVTRELQFEFTTNTTSSASTPDTGYSVVSGIYRETLTGLHKQPIRVQGTFQLSRASYIAELNPSRTP